MFAISALGLEQPFVFQHNPFLYASWMVHEAVLSKAAFQSSVAHQTNNPVSLSISRPPLKSVTHVLILGESTTSRRMSLYGYQRRTNPWLESIRANLLIDENACSSRGGTAPSLKEIFYGDSQVSSLFRAADERVFINKRGQFGRRIASAIERRVVRWS